MSIPARAPLVVEPTEKARASVIFFHGLGADGHDFEPIVPHFRLAERLAVRFVFPHAPSRPVTLNQGFVMPAWFDIGERDLITRTTIDPAGVARARAHVFELVAGEIARGIPSSRIVLGGFSQGGALAVDAAVRHPLPLAGLIALSTLSLDEERGAAESSAANRSLPAFVAHGTRDALVPLAHGRALRAGLEKGGSAVEWHEYPMEHEVCLEEIAHLGAWLARVLAT